MNTLAFILFLAQIGYPGGQIPGQYPPGQYPPGQYPPGQYPGTGVGIPLPGRTKKSSSDSSQTKNSKTPDHTVGVVHKLDDKSMEVQLEDTRIITFTLNDQTSQPKDLQVGYTVDVTSKQDDKGNYTADTIKVTKKGSAQTASSGSSAAETASNDTGTTTLKGPKYDSGDDGPPQLKRGKPAAKPRSDDADVADNTPPAATTGNTTAGVNPTLSLAHPEEARQVRQVISQDPREALIDRARDEAVNFIQGLPNYVCNENTTRYVSEGHVTDWHAIDVVTLELVYDGGKEDYRNIQINGKAVKGKVEDTGAWSTGEFGTILVDLMSPYTAAKFHYVKDASLAGFSTSLYDFTVERQNSHWHVVFASQSILPSYKGSIWVDKKSARVIRIEMQATNIPKDFPEDAVETAVDYGFISLGTEKFFLPTQAEILSCERGSNSCGRNVIEFRNYHRFTGDTKIIFDK